MAVLSCRLGGELLIAGGGLEQEEVFDPHGGKFLIAAGEMEDARHYMAETRPSPVRVLLAGGSPNHDLATAQAWIYKP
jgi:hypothetical protein